jgi:hypothetical protein
MDVYLGFLASFGVPLFSINTSLFSFLAAGFFGIILGLGLKSSGGYSPSANSGITNFLAPPRGRLSFGSSLIGLSILTKPSSTGAKNHKAIIV